MVRFKLIENIEKCCQLTSQLSAASLHTGLYSNESVLKRKKSILYTDTLLTDPNKTTHGEVS